MKLVIVKLPDEIFEQLESIAMESGYTSVSEFTADMIKTAISRTLRISKMLDKYGIKHKILRDPVTGEIDVYIESSHILKFVELCEKKELPPEVCEA